jgi:hypothetical protein
MLELPKLWSKLAQSSRTDAYTFCTSLYFNQQTTKDLADKVIMGDSTVNNTSSIIKGISNNQNTI